MAALVIIFFPEKGSPSEHNLFGTPWPGMIGSAIFFIFLEATTHRLPYLLAFDILLPFPTIELHRNIAYFLLYLVDSSRDALGNETGLEALGWLRSEEVRF